ncbi:Uncharacterised protein [Mycobacteroides abscessus]|nr:Uncharacterised protein [Mycobacteroides abscessus]
MTTGAPSSTRVVSTTRPPESSVPSTRTRTSERNQPPLPWLPSGVRVSVGGASSPGAGSAGTTVTSVATRPPAYPSTDPSTVNEPGAATSSGPTGSQKAGTWSVSPPG